MSHIRSLLAGVCLLFTFFPNTTHATTLKVLLRYNGNPICGWDVTLFTDSGDWRNTVSDADGLVVFSDLDVIRDGLDIRGVKKTSDGEKSWKILNFIKYDKKVDFGGMNGTYDDTYVILNLETAIRDQYGNPSNVENSWGLTPKYNDCGNSNNNSNGNNNSQLSNDLKDISDMRALQNEMQADRKAELEQQNTALKQKIERLKERVAQAKNEQAALTPKTTAHSNKSYDLRDLEIERDIAEIELDRNLDEQSRMGQGQLSKSDRQRYNDKIDALTAEQKQLAKNRKDGVMYGEAPLSKAEKEAADRKAKEEKEAAEKKAREEEDNMPVKIFAPEELANMSTFDLKKTKMANANGINRRKVKLKTKGAFLTEEVKARLNEQIQSLEKQIEDIKLILLERNEKED